MFKIGDKVKLNPYFLECNPDYPIPYHGEAVIIGGRQMIMSNYCYEIKPSFLDPRYSGSFYERYLLLAEKRKSLTYRQAMELLDDK